MIVLSSVKEQRVHNHVDHNNRSKVNSLSTVLTQKSINSQQNIIQRVGKKALTLAQTPLLSFTSFQSYLQDCNQNNFIQKQHDRLFRSQNRHKTQQNFNSKKQPPLSSQVKKNKPLIYQDQIQISPFQTDKQILFHQHTTNKSGKSTRNKQSKSQSSDYQFGKVGSFAERFLHGKFGSIDGWGNDNEQCTNGKNKFITNQSILKERPHENKLQRQSYKRQSTMEKQSDPLLTSNNTTFPRQIHSQSFLKQKLIKKSQSNTNNKQNVSQSLPTFVTKTTQKKSQGLMQNNQLVHLAKNQHKRPKNPLNCLSQINQLQQEILLSKRQDNVTNRSSNGLKSKNIKHDGDSNIMRLKREAEYLCSNEQQSTGIHNNSNITEDKQQNYHHKSASISIRLNNINSSQNYANQKTSFKPFLKFNDTDQNGREIILNENNEDLLHNTTPNCSFNFQHKSPSILKILQSINPNHEALLYKTQTPIKTTKNIKNYAKITGTESDMKNATKNRQKFHQSVKQRKSKSAFNSICKTQKSFASKQIPKISASQLSNTKNEEQTKFLITIVNSFSSVKNNQSQAKYNKNNLSLTKSINSSTNNNKEENQWRRLHTSESYNNNENDSLNMTANSKMISQFLTESLNQNEFPLQQIGSIQFGMESKLQDELQLLNEPAQPLEKLNKLSQEIKKMTTKISTPTPLSTKYNKKFVSFQKSIKNGKSSLQSSNFLKPDQPTENLCISQLEGRKIHKLRKLNEISS